MQKIIAAFLSLCYFTTYAQIHIGFSEFCCKNTTEWGNDEVYFLISGKFSNGATLDTIYPGNYSNIYMNDDKGDHICIGKHELTAIDLKDGESAVITVTVMEEDGDSSKPYVRKNAFLSDLLMMNPDSAQDNAITKRLQKVFPANKRDADDWIGTFEISIKNTNGIISTEWHAVHGIVPSEFIIHKYGENTRQIGFKYKQARYKGWFRVY